MHLDVRRARTVGACRCIFALLFSIGCFGPAHAQSPEGWTRQVISSGNVSLEVFQRGSGTAVLMHPSLGRPAQDFEDLGNRVAAAGYRVVLINPRGIGGSTGPMGNATLPDLAKDVWMVADSINVKRVHVLGQNFGNRVARTVSSLHPDQIAKMKELGLSPSHLIGHVRWWGKAFRDRILGPDRAKFHDPCASALAGGLRISFHSDYNVTPIGPLRCVQDAVSRLMYEGGDVFFEEERIPVEAALRAVTIDAAWQCQADDKVGSIEAGKLADFAILEQDPMKVGMTDIEKIKVSETWMNGERRHGS